MSCNGCRVLRKGCSEDCTLRPCLQWMKSSESQANAILFLAKFYGRAGLVNLINAGPANLRPEIFQSLLYEACGRIINPVEGSVGLMSSGNWLRCQAAVEEVLRGSPLLTTQFSGSLNSIAVAQGCDIRHLAKDSPGSGHRIRPRNRFKRSGDHAVRQIDSFDHTDFLSLAESKFTITGWDCGEDYTNLDNENITERAPSHDSLSVETVELALANHDEPPVRRLKSESPEMNLDLTLRLNPTYMPTMIQVFDAPN